MANKRKRTKPNQTSAGAQTPPVQENAVIVIEQAPAVQAETENTAKDLLTELANEIVLFHDEKRDPHFFYEGESYKAPSRTVENRIKYKFLQRVGYLPGKKDLKAVMEIRETKARFEGSQVRLGNRVTSDDDAIYYDLHDKRYIKVTPEGWEIIPADFPLYRRFTHMQAQKEPVAGGDPWPLFDFLTIAEENRLLMMVYLISLFIPRIAHPVLAIFGDQGSAKSFLCTAINRLVDPTLTERVIQPKNERDLIQTLRQKYVTVLDNLSKIDNRVSDIFCQVCTGGSISLRQLYTDEGENIAQFRHVVILNSVSLAIANADLMDRSIILKLHRISPEDRKPEQDLWRQFEAARPNILGGIFDTLVKAITLYPELTPERLPRLPRLADFAKWGYAIAEALGKSGEQFLEDFSQNIKRQNQSVTEQNVLCQSILNLMADQGTYLKSVADTHTKLKHLAGDDHRDETFPKLPHNLRKKLDLIRPTLDEHGITFQFSERTKHGYQVTFTNSNVAADEPIAAPATPPAPANLSILHGSESGEPGVSASVEIELDELPEVVNA